MKPSRPPFSSTGKRSVVIVAEDGGKILGHVAFSPVTVGSDAGWYGGSNNGNQGKVVAVPSSVKGLGPYADLYLPPLATIMLKYDSA